MRRLPWLLVAALLAGVGTADAQRAMRHQGFWIGLGLGGGWLFQEGAADPSVAGGVGYIRLGGTPSQRLLIGGEGIAWTQTEGNVTNSRTNTTFTLYFYPARRGLFVKGGVGTATARVETQSGNTTTTTTETELGSTVGAGFDIRVTRNFYITPNVDLLFQRISETEGSLLVMTIGVTWH